MYVALKALKRNGDYIIIKKLLKELLNQTFVSFILDIFAIFVQNLKTII